MRITTYFVAAAALLAAAQPATAQTWYRTAGSDSSVSYVDLDSVRNQGGLRYVQTLNIYAQPIDGDIYAAGIWSEYNCSGNYFRTLEYTYYDRNRTATGTEPSETINERKVPQPGSINEGIFDFVCSGTGGEAVADPFEDANIYLRSGGK